MNFLEDQAKKLPEPVAMNQPAAASQPKPMEVSDSMLASKQLDGILASGNPLMQKARARAESMASRRGLLNSSIAAEAGESAMIDAAMPLATADANTYGRAAEVNFNAQTSYETQARDQGFRSGENVLERAQQFKVQENDQKFRSLESGLDRTQQDKTQANDQGFRATQAGLERAQQEKMLANDQGFRAAQAGLDRGQQESMTRLQAQLQMDAEKSRLPPAAAAQFQASMQDYVGKVMSDPNIDGKTKGPDGKTDKERAIENYYAYGQQTMGWMSTFYNAPMPGLTGQGNTLPQNASPTVPTPRTNWAPGAVGGLPAGDVGVPRPVVGVDPAASQNLAAPVDLPPVFQQEQPFAAPENTGDQYERFQRFNRYENQR